MRPSEAVAQVRIAGADPVGAGVWGWSEAELDTEAVDHVEDVDFDPRQAA